MPAFPATLKLAVIGAGPQGLTLLTHLLQKRPQLRGQFRVFDPSGQWMQRWREQFAAQEIEHLRSPAVHHPDPHPGALRNFAEGRESELYPPYALPGTQLFNEHCAAVIQRWQLEDCILPHPVEGLTLSSGRFPFTLHSPAGLVKARRVILATGSGQPHWPDWAVRAQLEHFLSGSDARIAHSSQVDLRQLPSLQGEQILIIGGGLSSGHLALGAVRRGARVTLMTRRNCREKLFDADPGWLGPKYLKGFAAETDWYKRWQMIRDARDGGSFTPEVLTKLRRLSRDGKVQFLEYCQVKQATWGDNQWQIEFDELGSNKPELAGGNAHCTAKRIWLATGSTLDAAQHPLLQSIQQSHPAELVNGLPVLDQHLRWPGLELFVSGGLAALQLGPAARNLFGGRLAAERIVPAIAKPSLALPALSP
ncbi:MAG: lysine N(6)-hydroxylase/L-ornithine N(5)-oxygenase family protein [Synechococcales cyanobacterium RM1_1_8]|nr:lysine N(6)-hydroxylase/L-ornithine N(5)-oxygenase family protein [Synechococcales cyanobacterium RM1_1_8]